MLSLLPFEHGRLGQGKTCRLSPVCWKPFECGMSCLKSRPKVRYFYHWCMCKNVSLDKSLSSRFRNPTARQSFGPPALLRTRESTVVFNDAMVSAPRLCRKHVRLDHRRLDHRSLVEKIGEKQLAGRLSPLPVVQIRGTSSGRGDRGRQHCEKVTSTCVLVNTNIA